MIDREYPPLFDHRAERMVVGSMLLHPRVSADCLGLLSSEDFQRPAYALLFDTMVAVSATGQTPDPGLVVGRLESTGRLVDVGGVNAVTEIVANLPSPSNYRSWVEAIREKTRLRRMRDAIEAAADALCEGQTAAEVASLVSTETAHVGGSSLGMVRAGDVLRNGALPKDLGLSTGIRLIDEETATRGAPIGQLCVATASEGIGKSTLKLQMATHAAWSGRGVGYTSLADLNRERLVSRVLRMRCGYSSRDAASQYQAEPAFLLAESELREQVSFTIDDRTKRGSRDVDDVIGAIEGERQRRAGTEDPVTEWYVDYFQKLTSRKFKANDRYSMSVYCSSRLSAYAENSGLVLWVGSQITEGSDKAGTRDTTKDGRHLLEDAGLAVKIGAGEGWSRKAKLLKSRFGGQFQEADLVFSDDYLLFLPPGVSRPW